MKLYLVQHAEAKTKDEDPNRSLTEDGRRNAEVVAAAAAKLGIKPEQIRHSGKTRAEQTAIILAEKLNPRKGVSASVGLDPLDDVEPIAEQLIELGESVMLVGHLPFMERLTGRLVANDSDLKVVSFRNAGIVCLKRDIDQWQVVWILTPELAEV